MWVLQLMTWLSPSTESNTDIVKGDGVVTSAHDHHPFSIFSHFSLSRTFVNLKGPKIFYVIFYQNTRSEALGPYLEG
jgi:hypothetical protein